VTQDPNYAQLAATLSQEWSVASMARVLNISARLETKVKLATLPESVTPVNVAQMDYAQITRTKTVSTTKVSAKIFLAPLRMPQQHVPPNLVP
jgi:predicted transcriptional regulator